MKVSHMYRSGLKNILILILVVLLNPGTPITSYAQNENKAGFGQELRYLNSQHEGNKISDSIYCNAVDSILHQYNGNGIFFELDTLTAYLEQFRSVAWDSDQNRSFRSMYYLMIMDNAYFAGRFGEAFYFAEKTTLQYEINKEPRSFIESIIKCTILSESNNHKQVSQNIKKELPFIFSLPGKLKKDTSILPTCMEAVHLISIIIPSFIELNDKAAATKLAQISSEIAQIASDISPDKDYLAYSLLLNNYITQLYSDLYLNNDILFRQHLGQMRETMDEPGFQLTNLKNFFMPVYLELSIRYQLKSGDLKAAEKTLIRYGDLPQTSNNQQLIILKYKAELEAKKGDFKNAFSTLQQAMKKKGEEDAIYMQELNNLLYVKTKSEIDQKTLLKLEKQKNIRTILFFIVIVLLLIVSYVIYFLMKLNNRRSLQKIQELDELVTRQIEEINLIKTDTENNERQRLGRELHDNLSALIASLHYQVIMLKEGYMAGDTRYNQLMENLAAQSKNIYDITRNLSRQWYEQGIPEQHKTLESHIKNIINTVLPDVAYSKEIQIDEDCMAQLTSHQAKELLRTLQELFANIIRHSKAKKIRVLMYEDQDKLHIEIEDDGVGFNTEDIHKNKTMGLRSIQDRINSLQGEVFISSGTQGTTCTFTIPIER